jgi:hypothetical protein
MRLLEVFHLEDIDRLEDNLAAYFGTPFTSDSWQQQLSSSSNDLSGLSWIHVGTIARKRMHLMPQTTLVIKSNLSDSVEFIKVRVNQLFGAFFVLSIDATLSAIATNRLLALQSASYYGEFKLNSLLPWKAATCGYSMSYPANQIVQAVRRYLSDLRLDLEGFLKPILGGYFSKSNRAGGPALPAIAVFQIDNLERVGESALGYELKCVGYCRLTYCLVTTMASGAVEC